MIYLLYVYGEWDLGELSYAYVVLFCKRHGYGIFAKRNAIYDRGGGLPKHFIDGPKG